MLGTWLERRKRREVQRQKAQWQAAHWTATPTPTATATPTAMQTCPRCKEQLPSHYVICGRCEMRLHSDTARASSEGVVGRKKPLTPTQESVAMMETQTALPMLVAVPSQTIHVNPRRHPLLYQCLYEGKVPGFPQYPSINTGSHRVTEPIRRIALETLPIHEGKCS